MNLSKSPVYKIWIVIIPNSCILYVSDLIDLVDLIIAKTLIP